jgi:hypothetical protein
MEKKKNMSKLGLLLQASKTNEQLITGNNIAPTGPEALIETKEIIESAQTIPSHEVEKEETVVPATIPTQEVKEETIQSEAAIPEKPKKVTAVLHSEISLNTFLAERKKGDVVDKILIPRYQRDDLKVLSAIYNISMQDLAANVLDFFLENYGQDILKKLKKR